MIINIMMNCLNKTTGTDRDEVMREGNRTWQEKTSEIMAHIGFIQGTLKIRIGNVDDEAHKQTIAQMLEHLEMIAEVAR